MARDAALVSRWGASVRGREAKSLEVFMEFLGYWGKQAAEGRCSEPEAFFAADGSGGMSIRVWRKGYSGPTRSSS